MSELDEFRRTVEAWFRDNRPPEPDFLLPESFMEVGSDAQFEFLRNWQRKIYDAGYLGMAWPREYGGGGKPQIYQDIVNAEMARQKVPFVPNTIGLNWAGPLILAMGTEEAKKRYIKGILNADDIWCQGFSEPDQGSDLANSQLAAKRDGNDYVLNGSKIWTSLGSYAKYMILLARTNPQKPRYDGLSFFLVPMQTPGIEPRPIKKLTGEYGFTQTFFTDARIPAECLMGKEGEGWKIAMLTLTFERGVTGGQAGGISRVAPGLNDVVELARRSRRDGAPALQDPAIRDQIVRFMIEDQGDRLCAKRGEIAALCSERPNAIGLSVKLRVSEHRRRLMQFALSLQGANAVRFVGDSSAIDGGKWQRGYFNAFSSTIGGGTSQIQANIVGERVLGLPKD
ncbi:acyl-CoA dehydrogenase family protein [Bradyrhizobium sediminis]|uniref:Acyl-CoA dehydrogenase family protein n=1 Tax=Bradyrhizobium sediminis TaxID=2840469 RepID=A0A975NFZ4_9BRAD|nr:acyl-CoA dehydrogenase family protein [Bradyrhizobium sediminis]QWG14433.1 acyl-CoA dehydrogenase family protein [Bradyrhizobium sediminis]